MGESQTVPRKQYNKLFWFTLFPAFVIYLVIVSGLVRAAWYMSIPANRTSFFGSYFIVSACLFLTFASILFMYAKFLSSKLMAARRREPINGLERFTLFGLGGILYLLALPVVPVYVTILFVCYVIDNRGLKTM